MFLFPDHPRPDKHTDRVAWNASWEHDISQAYTLLNRSFSPSLSRWGKNPSRVGLLNDSAQIALTHSIRSACDLQQKLALHVLPKLTFGDFENEWIELDEKERGEIVLEGIYRTAALGYDTEQGRQWVPEINVHQLSNGTGLGYIQLLRQLLPKDIADAEEPMKEPIFVPHRILDEMFRAGQEELESIPGLSTGRMMFLVQRASILTLTVRNIFLAFYGEKGNFRTIKMPRAEKSRQSRAAFAFGELGSSNDEAELLQKEVERRLKERAKAIKIEGRKQDAHYFCWNCKKDTGQLETGQRLMACGRCKAFDRTIFYCSRDCQVKDYKEGFPIPHKSICGKPIRELDLSENTVPRV